MNQKIFGLIALLSLVLALPVRGVTVDGVFQGAQVTIPPGQSIVPIQTGLAFTFLQGTTPTFPNSRIEFIPDTIFHTTLLAPQDRTSDKLTNAFRFGQLKFQNATTTSGGSLTFFIRLDANVTGSSDPADSAIQFLSTSPENPHQLNLEFTVDNTSNVTPSPSPCGGTTTIPATVYDIICIKTSEITVPNFSDPTYPFSCGPNVACNNFGVAENSVATVDLYGVLASFHSADRYLTLV
jgi:hypothetical protein